MVTLIKHFISIEDLNSLNVKQVFTVLNKHNPLCECLSTTLISPFVTDDKILIMVVTMDIP